MPLYEFRCAECGRVCELVLRLERRNEQFSCGCPTGVMSRQYTAPAAIHVAGGTNAGWLRRG